MASEATAATSCTIENRTLTLGGRHAFFREAIPNGESQGSLVLLHGWIGTSSWMFRHVLPHLGRRYHTIAPDLPGSADRRLSKKPPPSTATASSCVSWRTSSASTVFISSASPLAARLP